MKQKAIHAAMQDYLEGQVILINKPLHWTSFDAVKKVRILTGVSKVGHAGTLDPLATGLLIICTGKFTKKINEYMGMQKEYTGCITIGATTNTYDLESQPENFCDISSITEETIYTATKKFIGTIEQVPPQHSAIKKDGIPAYQLARKGEVVEIKARTITISSFEIEKTELPNIYFRVQCTTGTYIRSLANDFGKELGTGAYLSELCRTKIGEFGVNDAFNIESFEKKIKEIKLASERQADA
jgi:tRNA pseudouridine55 synthase